MADSLAQSLDDGSTRFCFSLRHWCLWQSQAVDSSRAWPGGQVLPYNDGRAEVGFLPMMLRRRLSPLARAACAVAWHARQAAGEMPCIFFSRHGESQYYFEMLENMAQGEAVSPARFSLSVHNAIGGLFGFQVQSFLPYVALAGGNEDLFGVFIEAAGQLQEAPEVMLVCYEQPLPELYRSYLPSPAMSWALAMVLARPDPSANQLTLTRTNCVTAKPDVGQASDFLQAILQGQRDGSLSLEHSVWHWGVDQSTD